MSGKKQRELLNARELLVSLGRCLLLYIESGNIDAVFNLMLESLTSLTDSKSGFIAEVIQKDQKRVPLFRAVSRLQFPSFNALFEDVVATGNLVVSNKSRLGIPLFHQGQLVGVMGLAERADGYNQEMVEELQPVLAASAQVIAHYRLQQEKRRVDEALRQDRRQFLEIIDGTSAVIYVKDIQGRFLLINRRFEELFHVDREKVRGKTDYDLFPKENADKFHANDLTVLKARVPMEWEEVAPHEDGLHTYISVKFPLFDQAGVPYAVCGVSTDITERKRSEQRLRNSESKLKAIIHAEPECVKLVDHEGMLLEMNPAGLGMIEVPDSSDVIGQCIYSVISEPYKKAFQDLTERVCQGERGTLEFELTGLRGTRRWMETHAVPLFDEERGRHVLLAITREITERKRAEQERERLIEDERTARQRAESALQAREDFLAIAAHELRTPLTPLKMQMSVLKRQLDGLAIALPEALALTKVIECSDRQLDRLGRLVDDLLEVSRITQGRLNLNPEECDLNEVIHDLAQRYGDAISKARCILVIYAKNEVKGYWDRLRLEQVLLNLLTNAMKFGGGKPIEVRIEKNEDRVRISVRDHGIGISREDQERVFTRFERAVSLDYFGGLGLGLYIARQIVEAHGGSIRVESDPGNGSDFIIDMPVRVSEKVLGERKEAG